MTRTVEVALADRSYDILIGAGLMTQAGHHIAPLLRRRKLSVVTDDHVADAQLPAFLNACEGEGIACETLILPAGEATKNFTQLERLSRWLITQQVGRDDMVVALGGGVIGDLTGFAAAILRRGTGFIQVPTTLLAQVDSSVGGKTAINTPEGKNLIGAFHQPSLVLTDTDTLDTLPRREVLAGYAEIVKYGLLGDRPFFEWLEQHGEKVIAGESDARAEAVARSCQAKADIVAADERENGQRALLNLGHTFGHALEAEGGYDGRLLHGEAVAIGMVQALEFSVRLGLCAGQDAARARQHLVRVGLPVCPADRGLGDISAERLVAHMAQDKKVRDGRLTFVLARGIGDAFITRDIRSDDLVSFLKTESN